VETLNSMNEKNKSRKAAEYAGELLVITSEDSVYETFMTACQLYESGGLLNPDTNQLYREDAEAAGQKFVGRSVVPYTFKPLRGLGPIAVVELAKRITGELNDIGRPKSLPKVYLGVKPKSVNGVNAKQWCMRKRHKNNIIKELAKKLKIRISDGRSKDIYEDVWKGMKRYFGILRPHMDELLRRVGEQYLHKLTRRGEQPRTDAPVCPVEFSDEVCRVLFQKPVIVPTNKTAVALCTIVEDGSPMQISVFREYSGDGPSEMVEVEFPLKEDRYFAGGLMDLRSVPAYWLDPPPEGDEKNLFVPYSDLLEEFGNVINDVPFWMVILGAKSAILVDEMISHYFSNFRKTESDYVPAKGETTILSKKHVQEHNGIKIYILESPQATLNLRWENNIHSNDIRFQTSSAYGETSLASSGEELRMEVYLRYIQQVEDTMVFFPERDLFLSLGGGRKPAIAASVSNTNLQLQSIGQLSNRLIP
jgi:hypothetical protein